MIGRCWTKLPLLDFFPSRLYGLVIILWLTDESQELGQAFTVYYTTSVQRSCESDRLDSSQPNCFAFIEHTSILLYIHVYILHIVYIYIYIYIYVDRYIDR